MGCELLLVVCSRSTSHFALLLRPFLTIFLWYSLSLLVAVLNDWYLEAADFFFPFYLSLSHMLVLFLGAYCLKHTNWHTRIYFGTDLGEEEERDLRAAYRSFPCWKDALLAVGGMSVLAALSISARALALLSVDSSVLQTADLGGGLLVVLIVGVAVKQEKLRVSVVGSVLLLVAGVVCSNWEQLQGEPLGFVFAAAAGSTDALLVVLLYGLLKGEAVNHTPLDLIIYFSLPTFVLLLIPFGVLELPRIWSEPDFPFFRMLLLVSLESCLYFFLVWSGIILIGMSSALSFQVLSSLQPLLVFLTALVFFRQRLTLLAGVGSCILLGGLLLYALSRTTLFTRLATSVKSLWRRRFSSSSKHRSSLASLHVQPGEHEDWSGI